ncbi:ATP-dependent zinc protease family protein [Azorhizophilus paspali]|uniref:ATP-dependent zinc protease n=2 Tax=Azorhizophilus paspali TaxID=69963 RepID=A0ABV6SRW7_AZOPA
MRLSKPLPLMLLLSALALPAVAAESPERVFGWIEKGSIEPENIPVKMKLDTGALTSSLDAKDLRRFERDGDEWVRFDVEVTDKDTGKLIDSRFERRVLRNVKVRGAGGAERRPVVKMQICIGKQIYEEEFSLNDRGKMNYPVLIGRRTLGHLGLVDVSRTFTVDPKCSRGSAAKAD